MILKNVGELIDGQQVVAVSANDSVKSAAEAMAASNERAVVVIDGGSLVGILSDKDIVHRSVAAGQDPNATPVSAVMTADPVTVGPEDSVAQAIEKMLASGFHHLPVVSDGAVVGMVYSDDVPEEYRLLYDNYRRMTGDL